MKKKLIILSIIGIVLIGIIAGASFAYFSTANNIGNENVVTSGTMSLLFTDGQEVSANNLIPGEYIEKTFTVKNTGNVDTRYDVYFSEVINTFVDKTDLVYTLTSNDGGYNTTNEIQVPDTEAKIVNQQLITPNAEHTYTLRITFKLKQTNQNANMGRTFTAKININEYNTNTQEKLLKLIDASGNEVDKQIVGASQTNYTLALSNTDLTSSTNIYCNNGGIPTISGNTLNVSDITNDTICTISNDIADTINNKLTTSKTGIVMTNDQSDVINMLLNNNKEVILDLNGKSIVSRGINDDSNGTYNMNYELFRLNTSSLTINDATGTGGLYTGTTARPLYPIENSNLIINNGTFSGRQSINMDWGTNNNVVINDGNFTCIASSCQIIGLFTQNTLTINGGHFSTLSNNVIYNNSNSSVTLNDGFFEANTYAISNDTSGTINIYGGDYESNKNAVFNKGIVNIFNGVFNSNEVTINNNKGTINLNGGVLISNTSHVLYNSASDCIINVNQTSTPLYAKSLANVWAPVMWNGSNAKININANKADNCTSNPDDTTSGLCFYAEGTKHETNNTGNGVLQNISNGVVKIDGGSYFGWHQGLNNHSNGFIYVKNALVMSHSNAILNNNSNSTGTGAINICDCTLKSDVLDINVNTNGVVNYNANTIFTDNTNVPRYNSSNTQSVITQTEDACVWPSN